MLRPVSLVSFILLQPVIGIHLCLRNGKQYVKRLGVFPPCYGTRNEFAVSDQILPALALGEKLPPPLFQDMVSQVFHAAKVPLIQGRYPCRYPYLID